MIKISILALTFILLGGCQSKSQSLNNQKNQPLTGVESNKKLNPQERKQLKKLSALPFVLDGQTISASHILVSYRGAEGAGESITRTKELASQLIEEVHQKLTAGAEFDATAREYSDCPSKNSGGDLGTFRDRNKFSLFNKTTHSLKVGSFSKPIETSRGFQIVKRNKTEKVYTRHILIMHRAVKKRPQWVKRSKNDARELAEKLLQDIKAGNAKFADTARKYSDCSSSQCGGKIKAIGRLRLLPKFEDTAFKLKNWELSQVIETRFGFHIVQRVPESFALADKKNS